MIFGTPSWKILMLGAIICLIITPGITGALTPTPGTVVLSQDSTVQVIFVSSNCGYTNPFNLSSPLLMTMGDKSTPSGTTYDLGQYSAGTELIFSIKSDDGYTYLTGPAERNPDKRVHAHFTGSYGNWLIEWEDLYGGGDLDYNDIVLRVIATPVGTPVPEFPSPGIPMILAAAIGGFALFATRKTQK